MIAVVNLFTEEKGQEGNCMEREEIRKKIQHMNEDHLRSLCTQMLDLMNENQLEQVNSVLGRNDVTKDENLIISKNTEKRMSQEFVGEEMKQIQKIFRDIEEEELYLNADGYEDYSMGYWDSEWIWEYEDPMEIGNKLTFAANFAGDCIKDMRYSEALAVLDQLLEINVTAMTGADSVILDLEDLDAEKITNFDLGKLALSTLYAAYQVKKPEERAADLYTYFTRSVFRDVHMEDILGMGREELKDLDRFWNDWIALLETKSGYKESRLLREAALYYGGSEGLEQVARRSFKRHPSISLAVMEEYQKNHSYEKMLQFGDVALREIDKDLKIRGSIAEKAAFAASCKAKQEDVRRYCYEAFCSNKDMRSYLRLFGEKEMADTYGQKADEDIEFAKIKSESTFENNVLQFYAGNFKKIKEKCKNPPNSLGWTGTFIRTGIELFLIYLYEGLKPGKAVNAIAADVGFDDIAVNRDECLNFESDIYQECMIHNTGVFWNYFQRWKYYTSMEDKEKEHYLSWVEGILYKRADAIVGGKFRNHYRETALLLAALGEVKESMGIKGAKSAIQIEFKRKYPRHSAFQSEMRIWIQ